MGAKIFLILLTSYILTVSLGLTHNSIMIDNKLRPDYEKFVKIAEECETKINTNEARIEIDYSTKKEDYIAVTNYSLSLISVKYINFIKLTKSKQEQTLMYEMGHLFLDLRHDDKDLNLMNTLNFIPQQLFEQEYDYFIRKLFWECKAPLTRKFIHE